MKTQSAKSKGRRLQKQVRELILETFKEELQEDDVRSTSMGASGEDVLLSPKARAFSVECKNQEKLNIWSSLEQAEENANDHEPLLVFKRNRSKTYAVLRIEILMDLLSDINNS